jgi:hypothetical protein
MDNTLSRGRASTWRSARASLRRRERFRGQAPTTTSGDHMTLENVYGSRPDLLPRSMVRLSRVPEGGIGWVGREGIELLDLDAHRVAEGSFRQFPRRSDATIKRDKMASGAVIDSTNTVGERRLAALDEHVSDRERIVFIWDSLAVPSVRVPRSVADGLVTETVDTFAEFWVNCDASWFLVEFSLFKNRPVVARVSG